MVPVFTGEGVLCLLLETLLAFREALVPVILLENSLVRFCPSYSQFVHASHTGERVWKDAESNLLADSHDCDKSPSRGLLMSNDVIKELYSRDPSSKLNKI